MTFFHKFISFSTFSYFCARWHARSSCFGMCGVEVFSRQLFWQYLILSWQHSRNKSFLVLKNTSTTVVELLNTWGSRFFCSFFTLVHATPHNILLRGDWDILLGRLEWARTEFGGSTKEYWRRGNSQGYFFICALGSMKWSRNQWGKQPYYRPAKG